MVDPFPAGGPAIRFAKTLLILTVNLSLAARTGVAQVGGNVAYGQASGRARAEQNERAKRQVTRDEMPPTDRTMFVDASVLMNVKADEFVATFAVAEEAQTVEACQARMDATVAAFTEALKPLGLGPEALFVDFTAQTKVYDSRSRGTSPPNTSRLRAEEDRRRPLPDKALIDRLIVAASRAKIYDLVKVDYIVTDLSPIQERLAEAAAPSSWASSTMPRPRSTPNGHLPTSHEMCPTPPARASRSRAARIARG